MRHAEDKFEKVRCAELKYIAARRQGTPTARTDDDLDRTLIGLALSGGGIRSATTNLGILQSLSHMGILPFVDYLSTVSGGGYIGGCLASLLSINRDAEHLAGDDKQFVYKNRGELQFTTDWDQFPFNPQLTRLAPQRHEGAMAASGEPRKIEEIGKKIIAHLRTHGDFLIARRSIFRRDALRAVGTLLIGIVYHFALVFSALFVLTLLLLGAAHLLSNDVAQWASGGPDAVASGSRTEFTVSGMDGAVFTAREATGAGIGAHLGDRLSRIWTGAVDHIGTADAAYAVASGVLISLVAIALFVLAMTKWKGPRLWAAGLSQEDAFESRVLGFAAVLLLITVVTATVVTAEWTSANGTIGLVQPFIVLLGATSASFFLYPLFAFGQRGKLWSRRLRSLLGSYQAMCAYGLVAAAFFAVLPAASYAAAAVGPLGVLVPLGSLITGRLLLTKPVSRAAGRFPLTGSLLHLLLGVAVALLIGVSMVEFGAWAVTKEFASPVAHGPNFLRALGAGIVIVVGLGALGNINLISPHLFYRDRLLETYLRTEIAGDRDGRMRVFRDTMEMKLRHLHGAGTAADEGNTAPYLLISAALNLAGSRDLTRKDRKSGYFLFSKYYCGSRQTDYRETAEYSGGDTQLGRALAISGAAAGTGMGYQTFFAQSFLMALFNARLGYWVANPAVKKASEYWAVWPVYLLREMFGLTSERTRLVNVSDGGHTGDNIGIYPLLERRCQVIIACDAEADASLSFGSFTEALRHAYVDFGIDVDIDLSMLRPDPVTGFTKKHCAIGRIHYPDRGDQPSWIIYLKNSLTGDEPEPVLNYKRTSATFPHESTADQFFDDAQFESYRTLGTHIAESTFGSWITDPTVRSHLELGVRRRVGHGGDSKNLPFTRARIWDDLLIRHSPFRAAEDENFQELTRQLSELEKLFLETPALRAYYAECMRPEGARSDGKIERKPEQENASVADAEETRAAISHACAIQIQLMEDAYFSLRLDRYANARDNRGWMNLFRRWGRSPTFQACFPQLQATYSDDIEDFYWSYIHDWRTIDEEPIPHPWDVEATTSRQPHPSAQLCRDRGARGVFLDAGRRESGPRPGSAGAVPDDPELVVQGQHGAGTALPSQVTPPTPPNQQ